MLKLIESYRDSASVPRHRTVASLGDAPLDGKEWAEVSKAVEDILYGRVELLPRELSEGQRQWVDRITRQVNSENKWHPFVSTGEKPELIDGVLADRVSHTDTAEVGAVLVGWETWKRLGMPEFLHRLGFNRDQSLSAAVSVINRLVDPRSEHSLLEWYRRTGLPELMGNALRGAGDDRFYRVSDKLLTHSKEIEQHLRQRQMDIFKLERTVLLYDLTNTHFEGLCAQNPKAKRGKNKQKRTDCPQIVVGMVFDQYGFEMAHKIFEGNQHDAKSLVEMVDELNASVAPGAEKPLVIIDAGIATADNLALLREHGFRYLVNDTRVQRKSYLEYFRQEDKFTIIPGRPDKSPVMVRMMDDPLAKNAQTTPERVLLCKSEQRGDKEDAILSNAEKRFLQAVERLATRIEKGQIKEKPKIERAIGRLSAQHPRVNRFYTVALEEDGQAPQLKWRRDDGRFGEAAELCGCYVLRTDDQSYNGHDLWRLYITLTKAEDGFKSLKTDLGLRPNRHHKEERVDGHVFICILAYHLLRNILWTLEQKNDNRNWESLKRVLCTHCYTTIMLPTQGGQTHRIRKAGQPEECQKAIYQALGISWNKLPCHRSVVGGGQG